MDEELQILMRQFGCQFRGGCIEYLCLNPRARGTVRPGFRDPRHAAEFMEAEIDSQEYSRRLREIVGSVARSLAPGTWS